MAVQVTIFETQIHAMFRPGGEVHREMRNWARRTRRRAMSTAPRRKGTLANSIHVRSTTRATSPVVGFWVYSDADHAYWVHEGTQRVSGKWMRIPKNTASKFSGSELPDDAVKYRSSRAGQKAQPFLTRAMRATRP